MNILRLSTLSLTLAIAVMTLGISADGWAAPKCDTPPCGGGGGGGDADTTYTVNMTVDSELTKAKRAEGELPVMCTGTADKRLGPSFDPNLSCKVSLDDKGGPYEADGATDYCLFGVSVKHTNKGTKVMLFMIRDCDFANSTADDGYHTLELAGMLIPDPGPEAPDFHIEVDHPDDGADLTKINQPNKNVALDDKIFIGDMVYTVDPVDP